LRGQVRLNMPRSALTVVFMATLAFTLHLPHAARAADPSDWMRPFVPDEHTVVLYHFDEGRGNEAHDAMGDPALTLRPHREALWGSREGFGATARFERREDDGTIRIGPANNDKLQLRTCRRAWTVEAWVRYTGPYGKDWGNTYGNICGSDEEGLSLPTGMRGGWHLALHNSRAVEGLAPMARFIGSKARPDSDVNRISPYYEPGHDTGVRPAAITDENWHHVAWQFRYEDQLHVLLFDGKIIWRTSLPAGKDVINDAPRCDIPFLVGGFLHSQDPPFHLNAGNFEGEIDEIRISDVLRYPVNDRLAIVRRELPDAALQGKYAEQLSADAATGKVVWDLIAGSLPAGLDLDGPSGTIRGAPKTVGGPHEVTVRATDQAGDTDQHTVSLRVRPGRLLTQSLPVAFVGGEYLHPMQTEFMSQPLAWQIISGRLPQGFTFDSKTGRLSGVASRTLIQPLGIEVKDAHGQVDRVQLAFTVVPAELRSIEPEGNTVALWDWQGPDGKLFRDVMGDESLTLTWVNMIGDTRMPREGWGVYPLLIGGGEYGFTGPQQNDKVDLRTCPDAWTVEVWLKRGGPVDHYGRKFDYGHICGTYDSSKRGVWELYLSDHESPDGSMAPGVHFLGAEEEQALMDLHPWKRPDGIIGQPHHAGIRDTEWHHVAWQYDSALDTHQLLLDGRLIWQIKSPDGRKLVNNRRHDAQFSVGSRLTGFARYGGRFNYRGWGNYYGQIGEIRISNVRRYRGE